MNTIIDVPLTMADMKQLRFNPWHGDATVPILRKYPEIAKAWAGTKLSDISLHYICIVYDINNPTKQYTDDRVEQKKMAALFCGWPVEASEFVEPYLSYLAGGSAEFNKAIIQFVKVFNSASYTHLVTLFHQYDQICDVINNESSTDISKTKTRAEVVDKLDGLYNKIKLVEKDFFGEVDYSLNKELYRLMQKETKNYGISAEGRNKLKND